MFAIDFRGNSSQSGLAIWVQIRILFRAIFSFPFHFGLRAVVFDNLRLVSGSILLALVPFWLPLAHFGFPFAYPVANFVFLSAAFWYPWLRFGTLWLLFGSFVSRWIPFRSLFNPFGSF